MRRRARIEGTPERIGEGFVIILRPYVPARIVDEEGPNPGGTPSKCPALQGCSQEGPLGARKKVLSRGPSHRLPLVMPHMAKSPGLPERVRAEQ
ncbi:hypothetical protein GCM10027074_52540 [Streptomyces deserti]